MSEVPEDLDRLNELLGAIPLECEGMTIGELDGYVAGLIVCPEPVLRAESEAYAPVMEVDWRDGDLLWGPWINGVERAIWLRADAWNAIEFSHDDEAAASVSMTVAMNAFDRGEPDLTEEEEDEIDRTMPDLIHSMMRHLTAWKSAQPLHRVGHGNIALGDLPAHGRNAGSADACPWGPGACRGEVAVHTETPAVIVCGPQRLQSTLPTARKTLLPLRCIPRRSGRAHAHCTETPVQSFLHRQGARAVVAGDYTICTLYV